MMDVALLDLPILKLHVGLSALAFALATLALIRPKGGLAHRQAGRLALVFGGASALAALLWTLPTETTGPALLAVFALYAGLAGRAWAKPHGPNRLERALSGSALVGALAMVATGLWVLAGFQAETVSYDKAPLIVAFGAVASLLARWNVLAFARDVAADERRLAHGRHMIVALGLLVAAFAFTLAPRIGAPSGLFALIALAPFALAAALVPRWAKF